jgi:endonuclease/exonuclease/phosphatase family metal-dependent hydrolase
MASVGSWKVGERVRRYGRWCVVAATLAYAGALVAVWWLTTRVGEWWWLSTVMLYVPRILYGIPLPLLMLAAAVTDRRFLVAHGGCAVFLLGPVMGWHAPWRGERAPAEAVPIRVLTYNVGAGPAAQRALVRAVAETAPDVVVAQESGDLAALFPGWKTHHLGEYFLATRLGLLGTEDRAFQAATPWRRGIRYRLQTARGPIDLFSIHLDTPRRALEELKSSSRWRLVRWKNLDGARKALNADALNRRREAAAARAWIASAPVAAIVAGDFNNPADSPLSRIVWRGFRDAFAKAGSGYGYTAHAPRPWVRIDRILVSPDWRVSQARTAPGSGRDHLPVFAEIWRP